MVRGIIVLFILVSCLCIPCVYADLDANDSTLKSQFYDNGNLIDEREIGPGLPPEGWIRDANVPILAEISAIMVNKTDVPALDWSYGCSATSAAMYFGYFDRNGYPNFYVGPTNGGVFPLNNSVWGPSFESQGQCPLSASQLGLDGRVSKGHKNDYYSAYGSTTDPYYSAWSEHTPLDCIGDYMGTNQYQNWRNSDGSTTFYYNKDGSPLYDYTGNESVKGRDGIHGMKLFAESRGYSVLTNYNQYIYGYGGNTKGFTYDQYKAEIDAGYPVLIQVQGHTMLGVGYSTPNTVILHDTWDYTYHTMTWGGTYGSSPAMQHYAVGVLHLSPAPVVTSINPVSGHIGSDVHFNMTGSNFANGARVNLTSTGKATITTTGSLSGTNLTGSFTIPSTAVAGMRNVSVNQGGKFSNDNIQFEIKTPITPYVLGIIPGTGSAGSIIPVKLIGDNFTNGAKIDLSRNDATNISTTGTLSGTNLTSSLDLPVSSKQGLWNVTVSQGGRYSNNNVQFNVTAPVPPVVNGINPDHGSVGRNVPFIVTGSNFGNGSIINLTSGIEKNITSLGILIGPNLTGSFDLPLLAQKGLWNVTVNHGGLYSNNNIQFNVTAPVPPVVSGIFPDTGKAGTDVSFNITGSYFKDGAQINLSRLNRSNLTFPSMLSGSNLTVSFNLPISAERGLWNVTVKQDGLFSNNNIQFNITAPLKPEVTGIYPNSGLAGSTFPVNLTGNNFATGAIINLTKIGQSNLTFTGILSGNNLTTPLYLPPTSSIGYWNVSVNQGGQFSNNNIQFTINPALPVITNLNPGGCLQNNHTTSFPVTITGTGFDTVPALNNVTVDGSVVSYVVESATIINATFPETVDNTLGNHPVIVKGISGSSAPSNFVVSANGFTINASSDGIGWINPSGVFSADPGSSLSFTFNPTAGARVKNLTVNNEEKSTDSPFVISSVDKDYTIRLNNEPLPGVVISGFSVKSGDGNTVTFYDESLGGANKWKWDFGDGATSSEQYPPPHIYAQSGTYTVSLWSRNDLSQSQVVMGDITVPMSTGADSVLFFGP
ncbi:hypothetical protein DLD82_00045 [Methanospirillum stamsii]|uniref:PKD domain-containing protein n=2 Tax=Methanospirillum stamsii TaxID=1277351 RepID=A0A2V2NKV0_9EURY|nr:hypothetical protein DLD82_00045 [Methanospirillum stamsii]